MTERAPSSPASTPAGPNYRLIPLDRIRESPTQPRRTFPPLDELAASIREKGVLQPVVVRPVNDERYEAFELVVGACRFRASRLAEQPTIPAVVRELADDEVLEIQIVENAQRNDIHPMEEAEAYEQLRALHGRSVDEIAAKVGKSRSAIYARLKLCELDEKVRERFLAGDLTASTALLVARIPSPKLQREAAKAIGPNPSRRWNLDAMSYREAAEHIEHHYMLRLSEAPWKVDDAALVARAGSCTDCPKRTGNQRELFSDVESADVCTDPPCFETKREAWLKAQERAGRTVLRGKKASAAIDYGSKYEDLAHHDYRDARNRTHRAIAGKHLDEADVVLAVSPRTGELVELATKDKIAAAKKAAGWKAPKSGTSSLRKVSTAAPKRDAAWELARAADQDLVAATVEKARALDHLPAEVLRIFLVHEVLDHAFWNLDAGEQQAVLDRRGLKPGGERRHEGAKALEAWAAKASIGELAGLLCDLVLPDWMTTQWSRKPEPQLDACAKALGVDPTAIRKAYRERLKKFAKAAPKPPTPAKGGARPKKPKKKAAGGAKASKKKASKKKASKKKASKKPRAR